MKKPGTFCTIIALNYKGRIFKDRVTNLKRNCTCQEVVYKNYVLKYYLLSLQTKIISARVVLQE